MDQIGKQFWTTTEIYRLFKLGEKHQSEKTLAYAEEKGTIPPAQRVPRGKLHIRKWPTAQLPDIGKQYGFLKPPKRKIVISVYTTKGGVLKTTLTQNIARMLALNGIKTLMIGLDKTQESLTDLALIKKTIESIDSLDQLDEEIPGLYHYFYDKVPLENIIRKTDLPTLDIIPETPELEQLNINLLNINKREFFFASRLIPNLDYDVIIFDNGHDFNNLSQNSLCCANNVIYPMGCTELAAKAITKNLSLVLDFAEAMDLRWDNFIQVATLKSKNKLSEQIYHNYRKIYSDNIISLPIRHMILGDEANVLRQSVIEYNSKSPLAQDYYDLMNECWNRIVGENE